MDASIIISIVMMGISAITLIIAIITFSRNNKKDSSQDGQQLGQIISDLGYIKANVDEVKINQKQQSTDIATLKTDVAVIKATLDSHISDKSVHSIGARAPKSK